MSDKQLNDRLFDVILKEAFSKYSPAEEDCRDSLTEEDKAFFLENKEAVYKKLNRTANKPKSKKIPKRILLIAAVLTLCIAASMSVSAVREFWYKTYIEMQGDTLKITTNKVTDISSDITIPFCKEYNNISNYLFKNDIIIPTWLPAEMYIKKIDDREHFLTIQYAYGDYFLSFNQFSVDKSVTNIAAGKNTIDISQETILGMDATIIYSQSEIGLESYKALWVSDSCEYHLDTNLPKEIFNKILKNLKYLK